MRLTWLALAALSGLVVASPALAQGYAPVPRTSIGLIRTADRFWSGAIELEPCARPDVRRNDFSMVTPRYRAASQERHGELIGEILSPPPLVKLVVAKARDCASAAGQARPSPLLLTQGAPGFAQFHSAFAACMTRQDAAQYVGSMTLWIDNHCAW